MAARDITQTNKNQEQPVIDQFNSSPSCFKRNYWKVVSAVNCLSAVALIVILVLLFTHWNHQLVKIEEKLAERRNPLESAAEVLHLVAQEPTNECVTSSNSDFCLNSSQVKLWKSLPSLDRSNFTLLENGAVRIYVPGWYLLIAQIAMSSDVHSDYLAIMLNQTVLAKTMQQTKKASNTVPLVMSLNTIAKLSWGDEVRIQILALMSRQISTRKDLTHFILARVAN